MCKRVKYFLLLLVMVFFMSYVVIGCSKDEVQDGKGMGKHTSQKEFGKNSPQKLDNPNITIFFHAGTDGKDEVLFVPIEEFERKYGGKVKLEKFSDLNQRLVPAISAGDSPDLTYLGLGNMPQYAIMDVLQPIDDYIALNDPVWNLKVMDQMKFRGKYYCITKDVVAFYIYYNKTLFENNGLKTPLEHYKDGTWNWENFEKAGIALTQDIDKDGIIDIYGYNPRNNEDLFIFTNGGDLVDFKNDGTIDLTIKDTKVIEAIQFIQDGIYKYKYYSPSRKTFREDFMAGKVAMVAERKNTMGDNLKVDMKYEWDIVPLPMGPQGQKDASPAGSGSWGIPVGAKNPQGAIAWAYLFTKYDKDETLTKNFTDEQIARILHQEKTAVVRKYQGIGKMKNILVTSLWPELGKGMPVHSAVEKIVPLLQDAINSVMVGE